MKSNDIHNNFFQLIIHLGLKYFKITINKIIEEGAKKYI
jgi:hypothetical protein